MLKPKSLGFRGWNRFQLGLSLSIIRTQPLSLSSLKIETKKIRKIKFETKIEFHRLLRIKSL